MTQHSLIIDFMRDNGSITTFEAYEQLGVTKLTTRISELRRGGFLIKQRTESGLNRYGKPVTYNRYWLVGDRANKAGSVVIAR